MFFCAITAATIGAAGIPLAGGHSIDAPEPIFGLAVTFIALLQGYTCKPTPEGVSRATTRTVVIASLSVLGLDFILTAMMFSL